MKGTLQRARRPITLSEYMPKGYRGVLNTLSCYQIEGENEANVQEITNPQHDAYSACVEEITFISDDLLLRTKFHNRPLFVTGFIREQKTKRILVDNGLIVNIMPLRTMKQLGIPMDDLL